MATTTGTCMTASTLSGNRPARAALRRLGFRTVGIDDNSVELALTLAPHA